MKSRLSKNPYGKPGRGNYDKVWEAVKCSKHTKHTVKIENDRATVIHQGSCMGCGNPIFAGEICCM